MKFVCATFFLFTFSVEASVRALSAINEKATLDLEQIPGEENRYYARVKDLDFPLAGQTVIIERKKSGQSEEEFRTEGLGFSVRLGGRYLKPYTKPPTAGVLLFKGRDIFLTSVERPVSLADAYSSAECTDLKGQESAQKEIADASISFESKCGKKPLVEIEWKKFKEPGMACNGREFLRAFSQLCADADYKSAIGAVKAIKITTGDGSFSKSGNSFTYRVPEKPLNTFNRSSLWLEENL